MQNRSMATSTEQVRYTPELLRAWAWHRQGLDGSLVGASAAEVFSRTGWARSVGGSNPYLTLYSRARISRPEADKELASLAIHELPTARGCTYILGAEDFAWGLRLGHGTPLAAFRTIEKLGVDRAEIAALELAVLDVLEKAPGPLDPRALKEELGDAVRSLGATGRKKGASTTLPTALGFLQMDGRIRRVPTGGRLDQQRYAYTPWQLSAEPASDAELRTRLVERFLSWTGGATAAQIKWFSGFSVAALKVALADIGAIQLPVAQGEPYWIMGPDAEALARFVPASDEQIQLLAGNDALFLLRRNATDALEPADTAKVLGSGGSALSSDLPDHAIVDRGRIIGLWQYSPDEERIAYACLAPASDAVLAKIEEVRVWIAAELGDFRSFSLDSVTSRSGRIAELDRLRTGA